MISISVRQPHSCVDSRGGRHAGQWQTIAALTRWARQVFFVENMLVGFIDDILCKLEMVAWFYEPGQGVKAEPDAVGEERADKDQGNLAVCEDELQNTVTVLPSKANSTEGLKQFRPKPGSLAVDDDDDCRRAADWLASLSEAVVVMDFSKVPFALTILQNYIGADGPAQERHASVANCKPSAINREDAYSRVWRWTARGNASFVEAVGHGKFVRHRCYTIVDSSEIGIFSDGFR
ncbi:hypothetical protein C8F01DRAFT_1240641 [Mycena amicta]|nr:hypothetical protein C8F01DRAFT_1240641 [Mycena amicta]